MYPHTIKDTARVACTVDGGLELAITNIEAEIEHASWAGIPLMLHGSVTTDKPAWTCSHYASGLAIDYGHTPEEALQKAITKLRDRWADLPGVFYGLDEINRPIPARK